MTQQSRGTSSPDLVGQLQRWLVRSGARGVGREVSGQIRNALGWGDTRGDVWGTATAPPPPEGGADCGWCPVCRAARLLRESGPGLASHMSSAGDVLTSAVQEAMTIVESALANAGRMADQGTGQATGHDGTPPPPAPDGAQPGPASVWEEASLSPDAGDDAGGPPESPSHDPDDRD